MYIYDIYVYNENFQIIPFHMQLEKYFHPLLCYASSFSS